MAWSAKPSIRSLPSVPRSPFWSGWRRFAGVAAILGAATLFGSTGTAAHFAPAAARPAAIGAARVAIGGTILVLIAIFSPARRNESTEPVESAEPPEPAESTEPAAGGSRSGRGAEFWELLLRSPGRKRWMLVIGALGVAGYQISFFSAVKLTGVAIGTMVAIGSAPVFTGVISKLTGTAALSLRWVIATAGAIAGCAVLLLGGQSAGVNLGGAGLALLAGLSYTAYAITAARLIASGQTERPVMAIMFGAGAVLLLPVFAIEPVSWLLTWRGVAVVIELGAFTTALAYLLYGYGLRTVPVPTAVTLGLAEPVVAAVLALGVLGERLTATATIGVLLVAAALVLLALPVARPGRARQS
jgi:drug/metabolite transporter, DME family